MEELEIGDYINDINSYHLHMFDKHDVTTKKLDVIVEKAGKVDAVVLGKYGDGGPTAYTSVAKDMDAQYFQLDNWDELAARYSDDEIWKINEKFLDIQTSSGREIYLSHNPEEYLGKEQFYSRELQYLLDSAIEKKDIFKIEYCFFKDLKRIVLMALVAVKTMRFFYDNFQNLFQTADIGLLLANIVPEDCLFVIIMRKSTSWEMI